MTSLTLVANPEDAKPAADVIFWDKREVAAPALSIPKLTDAVLLEIRREHMEWAWKLGRDGLANKLAQGPAPSPWWTSLIYERHPKISPWLYDVYRLYALEDILRKRGVSELRLSGGDRRLRKTLRDFCALSGVKFSSGGRRPPRNAGWLTRFYWLIPAQFRGLLRLGHWLWKIKRRLPFAGGQLPNPPGDALAATIVTYFPNVDLRAAGLGSFRSRYWEKLHELLNKKAKKEFPNGGHFTRWLFIRFPAPQLTFGQCLALRDQFRRKGRDGLSFHYLEEFLTAGDVFAAFLDWLGLSLKSFSSQRYFRDNCRFGKSTINFWEYAAEQYAESFRGWRALERLMQNRAFLRFCKVAGRQRWNLFPLENCPWERMFTLAARGEGSPVYGAQHSIVRPTDFRYFDAPESFAVSGDFQPDVIGGNGESSVTQWLANGDPPERLRRLEALRYLYLNETAIAENGSLLPPEPGEPLEDPFKPRLLVLTSFFGDETKNHLDLLTEALDAGIFKDWLVLIKPHPYLPVDEWLAANAARGHNNVRLTMSPLSLALKPGVAVWASNSTTASLEAALKKLPLMVMKACDDFDLCPIQNIPGLTRTGNLEDVRKAVANLEPPPLPEDYLDLNPELPAWRKLLDL